ncbi:MAG: ThuA domain-containing protein [Mariniblastus sp.]|nr:ThuA domain-containing protein [Mariniblastus sp.]
MKLFPTVSILLLVTAFVCSTGQAQNELNVLFLGDRQGHQPRMRFLIAQPVLAQRGIKLTYTERVADLNRATLEKYDALMVYANIDRIEPDQAQSLLDFIAEGGGFVPIHCATYCFRNSPEVVALMGAQFKRHGAGVFRTTIETSNHPIMNNFGGFESWDETYVHHLHNEKNRTVLSYRVDDEGREPWTWIRTHGEGRVFYTAWGHDQRTWGNPGFQNLLERGIRWATKDDLTQVPAFMSDRPFPIPQMTAPRTDLKPFQYMEPAGEIPNYTPGQKWGVLGKPVAKMQKPLTAEESLKHIVVPDKFSVKLFASEPDIEGKPICMNWDERGRLWIAETYDYPNELQPAGKGRDRIRILEDTDGDWKADKSTVFADKLSIPTSLTFHRGGVIVQNGTESLYLKDLNGDDIADQRKVLFAGWTQNDTHGGVSNFQYGLDNWIWAMQGYNHSAPTVDGEKQAAFRMGFFRFRPDGSEIEFLRSTNNNTWGLGISEDGIVFGSTANRNPSVYLPIPNRYYERVQGWKKNLQLGSIADNHLFNPITQNIRQVDHHGGYTAAAGHAIYTAREYPQEYWNRVAFVNGPTGHLVGAFVLKPNQSDFSSQSPFNLFASDDEWSAPIMTEVGPDGNAWVLDWYNYIVQHNPTPAGFKTGKGNAYETPLRDKKYGRIYRVVYNNAQATPFSLAQASPQKLVETLKHPTMLWRKHAQRLLVERGKRDVVPALLELIADQSVDAIGLNAGAIHALWTLHGLGIADGSNKVVNLAITDAFRHPSAGVRRNAIQVLPRRKNATQALAESDLFNDPNAQVRLAALLALADLPPSSDAVRRLVEITESGAALDQWLSDALTSAAANQGPEFLTAIANSKLAPSPATLEIIRVVSGSYARKLPVDSIEAVIASFKQGNDKIVPTLLEGIAKGWPADEENSLKLTAQLETDLLWLLDNLPVAQRGNLIQLARRWGSARFESYARDIQQTFLIKLDDKSENILNRIAAAQKSIEFMPNADQAVSDILERITPQTDPELAIGLIDSLKLSQSSLVGRKTVERLNEFSPSLRSATIRMLLTKVETTSSLLDAIDEGNIVLSELMTNQVQALSDHPNRPIRRRARELMQQGGALPDADRQKVYNSLLPVTKQQGLAKNGKSIFKKQCANCHMHQGEGQSIGPDLTGMAVHPKAELLTHIIDPNRDVEGNFRIYKVMTNNGQLINGLLASESKTTIEIYDPEGKKQVLLRENIEQMTASRKSLMPEGFEKQITPSQMRDLLEFLTARGRYVPVDLSKVATLPSDRGMFFNPEGQIERMIFPDWKPKSFQGIPFLVTDPQQGKVKNTIVLHSPNGVIPPTLPKSVRVKCNGPAKSIHLLSGVSGWGHPIGEIGSVSLIIRLHYQDDSTEDHPLLNGVHFADYIRRIDVPQSEFAFQLRGQQIRYLAIHPKKSDSISEIELIKGSDRSAPIVMAVTIEGVDR